MPKFNLEQLMNEPIYVMYFQYMIGDVEDFLDFSERNIEWQYRQAMQEIKKRFEIEQISDEYKAAYERHLE